MNGCSTVKLSPNEALVAAPPRWCSDGRERRLCGAAECG